MDIKFEQKRQEIVKDSAVVHGRKELDTIATEQQKQNNSFVWIQDQNNAPLLQWINQSLKFLLNL